MSLNIDNLKAVRDAIADEDAMFDMSSWGDQGFKDDCGTPACICGWANALRTPPNRTPVYGNTLGARHWLGLTHDESEFMFFGRWAYQAVAKAAMPLERITRKHALAYLDKVIETGQVGQRIHPPK